VPLVTVTPTGGNHLRLTQRRFTNLGVPALSGRWQVPVVLQWSVGGRRHSLRVLLRDETSTIEIPELAQADWLHPNADEAGYYRWSLAPAFNSRLVRHAAALTPRERLGLLDNSSALLNAGQLGGEEFLAVLAAFVGDKEPEITAKVAAQFAIVRTTLLPPDQRDSFNTFSHSLLRPALTRVSLQPVAGEPEHVTPLRATLLRELGRHGRDSEVIAFAREQTRRYLAQPSDVDPAISGVALSVAAYHGDLPLWESIRTAFEQTKSPVRRSVLLTALGGVRDVAAVERALDYALNGPLNSNEFMRIPSTLAALEGLRARVVDWIIQHNDAIKARVPPAAYSRLINLGEGDDAVAFERLRTFYLDPANHVASADPSITKASERMAQRALLFEKESANVVRFLTTWAAQPTTDR
jgi:hypothetical protein